MAVVPVERGERLITGSQNGSSHLSPALIDEQSYPFKLGYQKKILAVMLRNRTFLPSFAPTVKSEYFSTPLLQDTAALILDLYKRFRVVPSFEELEEEIAESIARRQHKLPKSTETEWVNLVSELRILNIADERAIIQRVTTWAQEQALEQAILEAADLVSRGKHDGRREYRGQIRELINNALTLGIDRYSNVTFYFRELEHRFLRYALEEHGTARIPLMLRSLDAVLAGGVSNEELIVWAAPTGRGKTMFMCYITKAALYQGLNVAFFTCEMSKAKISERIDRALSRLTRDEMRNGGRTAQARIREVSRYKGDLVVVELMGKDATVEQIRAKLDQLRTEQGFIPHVILVDYPGVMQPSTRYSERRHELADIYRDLRTLAREWGVPVHSACQMNRASLSKQLVTIADLAECFEVAAIADIIFALCQTRDEDLEDIIRVFIAKNRDGRDHFSAVFKIDKAINHIMPIGEAEKTAASRAKTVGGDDAGDSGSTAREGEVRPLCGQEESPHRHAGRDRSGDRQFAASRADFQRRLARR